MSDKFKVFNLLTSEGREGIEVMPGTIRETVVLSDKVQVNIARKVKGALTPRHSHPESMVAVVMKGRYSYTVEDQTFILNPGDAIYVEGGTEHGPIDLLSDEDGIMLDIIAPGRGKEKAMVR